MLPSNPVSFRVVPDPGQGQGYSIAASEVPVKEGDTRNRHDTTADDDVDSYSDDDLRYTSEDDLDLDADDEGHCIWYGQCGKGWNQGALNCPVTNKTVKPPKLVDTEGLRILKKYCTELYHGKGKYSGNPL